MPQLKSGIVIAVDGPAASGKGTLSRKLSDIFTLAYLDTGLLYRAVGLAAIFSGYDYNNLSNAQIIAITKEINLNELDNPLLRSEECGKIASIVAAIPLIRAGLIDIQKQFANDRHPHAAGVIIDGRDIGTIICPDAAIKFFITASPQIRAKRRWLQLTESGKTVTIDDVTNEIITRDERDSSRAAAPLRIATGANVIDTSDMTIDDVVFAASAIIRTKLNCSGTVRKQ